MTAVSNKVRYINKQWFLNKYGNGEKYKEIKAELRNSLKISDTLVTLLMNRGIDTKEKAIQFLYGTMDSVHSPFLLKDMKKAVERTAKAIRNNEKIGAFTDFDADGTTSNAIFGLTFQNVLNYNNFELYIPHRELEGYGLNCKALKKLQDNGCSLVISADIGITAFKEAAYCKEIGLDLIVTDHHLPKFPENYNPNDEDQFQYLPQAYALVNPNRPDCTYPFKGICGCAVAYKFLCALMIELGRSPSELDFLIPIVATAIVADIVPIVDENRVYVKKGLEIMNSKERSGIIGLDALIDVVGYKQIDAEAIGFGLAPRINACGRLEHAMLASELLRTNDPIFAKERAKEINTLNEKRQEYTKKVIEKIYEQIDDQYLSDNIVVCLHVQDVHVGVVGIGAGQVTEKLHRPCIIVTDHPELEGYVVGSARSIKAIHILNVLNACKDAFDKNDDNQRFGGHSQAAGLTISKERFPILQQMLKDYFIKNPVDKSDLTPKLLIDATIRVSDINGKLMEDIEFLAPYGEGNPRVQFGLKSVSCTSLFYKGDTLGIKIPTNTYVLSGVAFKMQDKAKDLKLQNEVATTLDIAFQPTWNDYKGTKSIQLSIADIKK
jgi:single-stranded-DNA-specific exonuclease